MKGVFLLLVISAVFLEVAPLSSADRIPPQLVDGELRLIGRPEVGGEAILTLVLRPAEPIDQATVEVIFRPPRGTEPLGETRFIGSISWGETKEFSVKLLFKAPVPFLSASVYVTLPDGRVVPHQFTLPLTFPGVSFAPSRYFPAGLQKRVISFAPGAGIALEGRVLYFDDNAQVERPIRRVKVRLLAQPGGKVIGETLTDSDGNYSFSIALNPPLSIYIEVRFENEVLHLTDSSKRIYAFKSLPQLISQPGIYRIDYVFDSSNAYRALGFIHNTIMDAYDFLLKELGWSRRAIRVEYPSGDWPYYHYWWRSDGTICDESITIPAGWEWKRTTILHEYGHAVMTALYGYNRNNLPEGEKRDHHSLTTVSDREFAMKEGWAEFFEALIDDNAFNVTYWIGLLTPNIEENEWWTGDPEGEGWNTDGSVVEGAVASVLWDIVDTPTSKDHQPNVDDDLLYGLLPQLWRVMDETMPKDIIQLWEGWMGLGFDLREELAMIFSKHHIPITRESIVILSPSSEGAEAMGSYVIRWVDDAPGVDARISLYACPEGDVSNPILIAAGISEDDETDSFVWDLTRVPPGRYLIYAVMDDGVNPPVYAFAKGYLTVYLNVVTQWETRIGISISRYNDIQMLSLIHI